MLQHFSLRQWGLWLTIVFAPIHVLAQSGSAQPVDVVHYDLELQLDAAKQRLAGTVTVAFQALANVQELSLDLHDSLKVARAVWEGKPIPHRHEAGALRLKFPQSLKTGEAYELSVVFYGQPAERYPGEEKVWRKDHFDKDWVVLNDEWVMESGWWPAFRYQQESADSAHIHVIFPRDAMAVAPGTLQQLENRPGGFQRWTYLLEGPLHPRDIEVYVGDYVRMREPYTQGGRPRVLTYYILAYHHSFSAEYLVQQRRMLAFLEQAFGPYPYWHQGYTWVESSPFYDQQGHQRSASEVFSNNKWGFDAGLLHDLSRAWFGRNIQAASETDLWVINAIRVYIEAMYVQHLYDQKAAREYLDAQAQDNRGAWMLFTLSSLTPDWEIWQDMLREMSDTFSEEPLTGKAFKEFFASRMAEDYEPVFNQYLHYEELPIFEYRFVKHGKKTDFEYRWRAIEPGFNLPITIAVEAETYRLSPTKEWQALHEKSLNPKTLSIDMHTGWFEVHEVTEVKKKKNGKRRNG
ncbi:hypothetical protein [Pontibacter sp. G13]|uniref:hypothetical protein n=1 Tax=Pontibacter sp. G13 TaxID=3074898 RepID=UPI002889223E|nr:hypothetical protein [Pontibacter sp. G13]WNJ20238.1 hypothetical protein RJD25_07140 [Pontibacter sp. G13]